MHSKFDLYKFVLPINLSRSTSQKYTLFQWILIIFTLFSTRLPEKSKFYFEYDCGFTFIGPLVFAVPAVSLKITHLASSFASMYHTGCS